MSKVEVSIIVPVYNSLKTINRCVQSLVSQTLQNIEILLVDDCSTDGTAVLLSEWEKNYSDKIRVLKTAKNLGPGGARNLGVCNAKGEYIGFVDSDDYVASQMYELLLNEAKKTGYEVIDSGIYFEKDDKAILYTGDECIGELTPAKREKLIVHGGYCVTKLFRKELFEDPYFKMRNNCGLEDADFITYLFGVIKNIGSVKNIVYFYSDVDSSLSKPKDRNKYNENIIGAMENIYRKMSSLDNYQQIIDAVEYEIIQMYTYGVINALEGYLESEDKGYLIVLNKLREIRMKTTRGKEIYNNQFVLNKIGKDELNIIKLNDANPKKLLESVYRK